MELVYDDNLTVPRAARSPVSTTWSVNTAGEIFVAEDGGNMEICVIDAARNMEPFLRILGHAGSEITGPAFGPGGVGRLYFSSQRGTGSPLPSKPLGTIRAGITYEVRGPFRATTNLPAAAGGPISTLVHTTVEPPVRTLNPTLGDTVHTVDRTIARLGL